MALIDVLRLGVRIANNVTKSVHSRVTFTRVTARDGYGNITASTTATLVAVVEVKNVPVKNREGVLVVARATLDFIDVAAISAATDGTGFDYDDEFVLQNGSTGPVLSLGGVTDPGTGIPLATTVYLG